MENSSKQLIVTKQELKIKNAIIETLKKEKEDEDGEAFKTAAVLLAMGNFGCNLESLKTIKRVFGYDSAFLAGVYDRSKACGVVSSGKLVHSGWFDKETGGIAFWMDVMTVMGLVERKKFNQHSCKKCKHEWVQRGKNPPKVCPECKTVEWDTVNPV